MIAKMKWVKRLFKFAALMLVAAVGLAGYSFWKSRRNPEWYKPQSLNAQDMEALAHRAENQLQRLNNMASRAHANESAARHGTTVPVKFPPEILHFREDELNALLTKWSAIYLSEADRKRMDQYFGDPQVHFQEGQIIVAGTVKDVGRVVSIHLRPVIDAQGRLGMNLVSVYAGELPIPEAALSGQIGRLDWTLEQYLPAWQHNAQMDPNKGSNDATVKAAMSELALDSLHHQPAIPVFFLKTLDRHVDPVKLTDVKVGDGFINLAVEPMTADERSQVLHDIQQPWTKEKADPE